MSDLAGVLILVGYYLFMLLLLPTILKTKARVPTEIVRKLQHILYSLSIFLLLELFSEWYLAIAASFLLLVTGYPVLLLVENSRWYRKTFVDRVKKGGELRKQLLFVKLSFAVLITVYWGLLGPEWKYAIAAAVMAWGFGDAAAALVGKSLGIDRVLHRLIDVGKTIEGTGAMILFAGLGIFFTLLLYANLPWYLSLIVSLAAAPVSGVIELFSKKGTDTFTVPFFTSIIVAALVTLLTYLGVGVAA